jgi:hypothetical protein
VVEFGLRKRTEGRENCAVLTPGFIDAVEQAIRDMWEMGMVPSIQRLEEMMKRRYGAAETDMIWEAIQELEKQNRLDELLPLDGPETGNQK